MGRRERMSSVDTAWLRMDSGGNLMVIVGVYELEGRLDAKRLRALLQDRFASHFRMRARVIQDATGYYWEEVDDFDIDRHLLRVALDGDGGIAELKLLTGRLASEPLASDQPLWQFHLIDNYNGGQALVARIHHCIADGIALIGVLLAMTSDHAAPDPVVRSGKARASSASWDAYLQPLTRLTVKAIDTTGDVASKVLAAYATLLSEPQSLGTSASEALRIAAQVAKDAAGIALMTDDTPTSLKGSPSGNKVVAWNDPLPLDEVKAVSRALGCSINDVLLACVAGAIRSYLERRGEPVEGCELRAMVPVNLRDPASWKELGNKFGLVPLLLPVGIVNPIARVFEVRSRMDELKKSYTAVLAMMVLGVAGLAPRIVQQQALNYLARKGTAVMTNVPGPQQALYLAGARIERLLVWVPQSGDICVGVSILSYNGGVQFGLITDHSVCPEPRQIIERFAPEFEKLVLALCLLPWDGAIDADRAEHWLFPALPGPRPTRRGKPPAHRRRRAAKAPANVGTAGSAG
jgi:diacylglycerol O-acyltransferase / wax synthase